VLWLTQRQLKSKDPATRRKALQQLCDTPNPRALESLREVLQDEDPEVRQLAATALGKLRDDACLEPLLAALQDRDPDVQKAVIQGLKTFSGDKAINAILPLLRSPDAAVRGQAAQALQMLGWRTSTDDDEIWFWTAKGQFARVVGFGDTAVPALENVLRGSPYGLCVGAIQGMSEIGGKIVVRPLLSALSSNEAAICVAAVEALGKVGGSQLVQPLLPMLRHQNNQVRAAAVEALGDLRAPEALEPIRHALTDTAWEVRRSAAETLGLLDDSGSVEALTKALNDTDDDVRETAALALGRLRAPSAIGALVTALKDSTSGVRRIAAASLSRIDEHWANSTQAQAAFEKLKPALEDEDAEVRHFVGHLLTGVGAVISPAPTDDPSSPKPSVDATEDRRHKLAVSLFLAILCDANRDLRQAAAEALGRLADRRAEAALVRALGDNDPGVHEAAEQALKLVTTTRSGTGI
jgi:HEAT repeat protein